MLERKGAPAPEPTARRTAMRSTRLMTTLLPTVFTSAHAVDRPDAATVSDHLRALTVASQVNGERRVETQVESPNEFADIELWDG